MTTATIKKILVTGGLGFIGAAVSKELVNSETEVYVLYKSDSNKLRIPKVNYIQTDLTDKNKLSDIMLKVRPNICVHCAWLSDKVSYWNSEENKAWVQYSTELFNEFASVGGEKFIALGSCAEYVWRGQALKEEVDTELPESLYGRAKLELANSLLQLSEQHNIPVVWARIFFCFGPGEAHSRLVPSVIKALLDRKEALCSDGSQVRDYMYLEDIARAIKLLVQAEYEGKINIASGRAIELKSIVSYIAQRLNALPLLRLGALPRRENDVPSVIANVERLSKLGFKTSFSLEQGLDLTIKNIEDEIKSIKSKPSVIEL